jgi:CRP-like cAMP-binding protein
MPNFFDIDVHKGFTVIEEGKPADRVYIIKDGEFKVTKKLWTKAKEPESNI